MPSPLEDIMDTARWIAFYRAVESERPDALFHDSFARGLAGLHGEEIARRLPGGRQIAWITSVRTRVHDEIIGQAVANGVDTVLNLAAGLDTRPYRLALPPSLKKLSPAQTCIRGRGPWYPALRNSQASQACR